MQGDPALHVVEKEHDEYVVFKNCEETGGSVGSRPMMVGSGRGLRWRDGVLVRSRATSRTSAEICDSMFRGAVSMRLVRCKGPAIASDER